MGNSNYFDVFINGEKVGVDVEEVIPPTEEKPYWQLIYKEGKGKLCVPKKSSVKYNKSFSREGVRHVKVAKKKNPKPPKKKNHDAG